MDITLHGGALKNGIKDAWLVRWLTYGSLSPFLPDYLADGVSNLVCIANIGSYSWLQRRSLPLYLLFRDDFLFYSAYVLFHSPWISDSVLDCLMSRPVITIDQIFDNIYKRLRVQNRRKKWHFPPNFRNGIIWSAPFPLNIRNVIIWGMAFPKHLGLQKHVFR